MNQRYIRRPEHDRRMGHGDNFSGDAWEVPGWGRIIYTAVGVDPNTESVEVEVGNFEAGDIVEVCGLDGRLLGRAIVTEVSIGGTLLAIEYEEPHESLFGRRNDTVSPQMCRKVGRVVG